MAQKTVVLLEDDLDGGPADETVTFALDGVVYEIDLRADNAARLREVFAPYAGAGRRVGRRAAPPRPPAVVSRPHASRPARSDPAQLAAIRSWARARGIQVSDRGRIPAHIIEQYHNPAATSASSTAPAEQDPTEQDPAASVAPAVTFSAPAPPPSPARRSRRR